MTDKPVPAESTNQLVVAIAIVVGLVAIAGGMIVAATVNASVGAALGIGTAVGTIIGILGTALNAPSGISKVLQSVQGTATGPQQGQPKE